MDFFQKISLFTIAVLLLQIVPSISENSMPRPEKTEDLYSSLIGVQNLAQVEQHLVAKLVAYKLRLTDTLELLNKFLDDYKESIQPLAQKYSELREKAVTMDYPAFQDEKDVQFMSEQISANPLAVFKLLRRFAFEFEDIKLEINSDDNYHEEFKTYINDLVNRLRFPQSDDLDGAADGLLRLQETYQLPTTEMVNGVLIEKRTNCKLPAFDMWYIGRRAANRELYATGLEWMYQAYQKVLQGDESMLPEIIKDDLSAAANLVNDFFNESITHNDVLLKFNPSPSNVFTNLVNATFTNIPELYIPPAIQKYPLGFTVDSLYDLYNFNALCRGEQLLPQGSKGLSCNYLHKNSLFNIISPLKVEILCDNPLIYQVYDIISEKVIDHIKRSSLPHLKRSKVISTNSKGVNSDVRVSSVAWLLDRAEGDNLIKQVPQNVKRATGLKCETYSATEDLQVSCYGSVGGHYIPHIDALLQSEVCQA